MCGVGETLLFPNIIALTRSLVDEGHFIQIVTNASITKVIHEFIDSDISANKVFFKCSLHYMELKKRGLLKQYAMNVKALMEKGFSITVELVPHDELIEWIDEIKSYCLESFHALPHVTVTRDESKGGIPIDSLLDEEEYRRIWGSFGSALFDVKMDYRKKYEDCHAGLWAVELNLATGELYKCTNNPRLCNIYENIDVEIPFEKVGNECCLPYCFNCHAYITLGLVPGIDAPTYLEMRDRVTDGKRWITDDMREIFRQKLYENNTRV